MLVTPLTKVHAPKRLPIAKIPTARPSKTTNALNVLEASFSRMVLVLKSAHSVVLSTRTLVLVLHATLDTL